MLVIKDLTIHFGDRVLFNKLAWTIKPGEKIALVGRNGVGKTTLFKVLTGEAGYDGGSIALSKQAKVGLLKQDIDSYEGHTVRSLASTAFPEIQQQSKKWSELEKALSVSQDDAEIMSLSTRMSDLAEEMNHSGAHQKLAEAEKVLKGLGFGDTDMERPIGEFSGGWQMRILLARLLLMQPDYLLLDEPTNHLDIVSVIWLEQYLKEYNGTYIVISHDRRFLNSVARKVAELEGGILRTFSGNYDQYLIQKAEQREVQLAAFKNQQSEIARKERLIDKYRAKASKASTAKALQSELNRMEVIEVETDDTRDMKIRFPDVPRSGERVIDAVDLCMSYGDLEVFNDLDFHILRGQKVSLIGQNGQGKTTLAKIISGSLNPVKGSLKHGSNVQMEYFAQDEGERIDPKQTVLEWLEGQASPEMRPRVRHVLGAFLFSDDDVDKKVQVLSGGERSRLAMAAMVLQNSNFLLLDEPTNHLDMRSKDVLKAALEDYQGALLVISHDREFLKELTDHTMIMHDGKITHHLGDVDSFLDQKGFESLMDFALSGDKKEKKSKEERAKLKESDPIRKQIEKDIKKVERKIEDLESQIKSDERQMAEEGFFEEANSQTLLIEYNSRKSSLENLHEQWEDLVSKLEG